MEAPPLVLVVCGDTHGVLDVASFTILTRLRDGTEELLNPTAFEREAGRGRCKKWKTSIKIWDPKKGKAVMSLGAWAAKHDIMMPGYMRQGSPAAADHGAEPPAQEQPPASGGAAPPRSRSREQLEQMLQVPPGARLRAADGDGPQGGVQQGANRRHTSSGPSAPADEGALQLGSQRRCIQPGYLPGVRHTLQQPYDELVDAHLRAVQPVQAGAIMAGAHPAHSPLNPSGPLHSSALGRQAQPAQQAQALQAYAPAQQHQPDPLDCLPPCQASAEGAAQRRAVRILPATADPARYIALSSHIRVGLQELEQLVEQLGGWQQVALRSDWNLVALGMGLAPGRGQELRQALVSQLARTAGQPAVALPTASQHVPQPHARTGPLQPLGLPAPAVTHAGTRALTQQQQQQQRLLLGEQEEAANRLMEASTAAQAPYQAAAAASSQQQEYFPAWAMLAQGELLSSPSPSSMSATGRSSAPMLHLGAPRVSAADMSERRSLAHLQQLVQPGEQLVPSDSRGFDWLSDECLPSMASDQCRGFE